MNAEKLTWNSNNHSVSWEFEGKIIERKIENINFASVDLGNNLIYIESGKSYLQEQIYNFSFDGEQLFTFDKVGGVVSWMNANKLIKREDRNILMAGLYGKQKILFMIIESEENNKKLDVFSLGGELLFECEPPEGYRFEYLSSCNDKPSVVCYGGKDNEDTYGRCRWHFVLNPNTNALIKASLAY